VIVVADTSPLRYMVLIEHVHVRPALYGHVVVPPAVVTELDQEQTPELVRRWLSARPEWLHVRRHSRPFRLYEVCSGLASAKPSLSPRSSNGMLKRGTRNVFATTR